MANPRLSKKLEAAVKEKLAAEDSHIIAQAAAADIPSDSPSLAASSETPDTAVADSIASPPVRDVGDEPTVSSKDGVAEGGVLLEPGVASVEELFESDVFSKSPVSWAGKKDGTGVGEGRKADGVGESEGSESKEKLRA